MARRRMLSEEILYDEEFNTLSLEAQNLFVRMLAKSDDCGVIPSSPYVLATLTNPPEKIRKNIGDYLAEIQKHGLGLHLEYRGKPYFVFKPGSFGRIQSYIINKRVKSEYLNIPAADFDQLLSTAGQLPVISQPTDGHLLASDIESRKQKVVSSKQKAESNGDSDQATKHFEKLWAAYPRRVGRKDALRHYGASVTTEQDRQNIERALENYVASVEGSAIGYIKHGSTWFGNWRDWVDYREPAKDQKRFGPPQDSRVAAIVESLVGKKEPVVEPFMCPYCNKKHSPAFVCNERAAALASGP